MDIQTVSIGIAAVGVFIAAINQIVSRRARMRKHNELV